MRATFRNDIDFPMTCIWVGERKLFERGEHEKNKSNRKRSVKDDGRLTNLQTVQGIASRAHYSGGTGKGAGGRGVKTSGREKYIASEGTKLGADQGNLEKKADSAAELNLEMISPMARRGPSG